MSRSKYRQINEPIWSLDLSSDPIASKTLGSGASITWGKSDDGRDCLICVPSTSSGNNYAYIKQTLTANIQFKGVFLVKMRIKATSLVSPGLPAISWTYSSATFGGSDTVGNTYMGATEQGTYTWKEVSMAWYPNEDTSNFQLRLGVVGGPGASGTLYISDVQILSGDITDVARPTIDNSYVQPGPQLRGFQVSGNPSRDDIFKIKSVYKGNLIRHGIYNVNQDYPQATTADLQDMAKWKTWFDAKAQEVIPIRNWCRQNGIKIALNLGRMPGYGVDSRVSGSFYTLSADYHAMMIYAWKTLATMFAGDQTFLGFDIVNEPGIINLMVPGGADHVNYITGINNAIREIRAIDPSRTIIAESFLGIGHPLWVKYGALLPFDNVIYSAHIYQPGSSYNLSTSATNNYPGFRLDSQQHIMYQGRVNYGNPGLVINKEYLRNQLQALRDFQLQYKVPIYIGEFGLNRWCLGAAQWYTDICSLMNEYGWHYTCFEYNNGNFHPEYSATPVGGTGTYIGPTTDRSLALQAAMSTNVNPFSGEPVVAPSVIVRDISASEVCVSWALGTCSVDSITVGYRRVNGSWIDVPVVVDKISTTIGNLIAGVSYEFRVIVASTNGSATGTVSTTKSNALRALETLSASAQSTVLGGYGMRILSSSYSGPILSVRRSSDNSTIDIGADGGGEYLNVAALMSHCGTGDGYVTKWWDTTGQGKHIDQSTTTRQAKIVSAGVLNALNTIAALKFEGNQGYGGTQLGMFAAGSMTIMGVGQQDSGNSGNTTICGEFSSLTAAPMYWVLPGQAPGPRGETKMYVRNDASTVFAANLASLTQVNGFPIGSVGQFLVQDRGHQKIWIGSKDVAEPVTDVALANGTIPPLSPNRFVVGARDRVGIGFDAGINAQFQEIIVLGSILSNVDVSALKANQLVFYKVN